MSETYYKNLVINSVFLESLKSRAKEYFLGQNKEKYHQMEKEIREFEASNFFKSEKFEVASIGLLARKIARESYLNLLTDYTEIASRIYNK